MPWMGFFYASLGPKIVDLLALVDDERQSVKSFFFDAFFEACH